MTGQGSWNKPTSSKSSEKSQFRPNDFMYIPNWQLKEFLGKFAWRLKPLFRIIMAYWPFDIYNSRYIFCKPFYNIARKFVFSNSIARAYFIFLLCTLMTSTNKSLEEKNFPSGWKCYKTIGSCQLCVHQDMKHLGSLESTQEARNALGYASSNSYTSFVLSKLSACFISRWTHADVWTNR